MKNDCSGPAKSSRFDFNITDDNFEDLQPGYPAGDNYSQFRMVCKGV